jgi:hypothetical protein
MILALISCTKSKQNHPCKAKEMYSVSNLFSKAYDYALQNSDQIAILSAKYGLLLPDESIEPYELTLKKMADYKRREWTEKVLKQIEEKIGFSRINKVIFLAGKEYRENIALALFSRGISYTIPIEGLTFGRQLQWYNEQIARARA